MLDAEDLFPVDELDVFVAVEECPECGHTDDEHDEFGCHHDGCECPGP